MITIAKLRTLKPRTCVRKIACLFHEAAVRPGDFEPEYLSSLCGLLSDYPFTDVLSVQEQARAVALSSSLMSLPKDRFSFACEDLHQLLLSSLGAEPADWDFLDDASGALDVSRRTVLPHTLVLDRIRSPFNVGSLFRSADSFGVQDILLVEGAASPDHPRAQRTARGCTSTVPWRMLDERSLLDVLQKSGRPMFALELGGDPLSRFPFPPDGIAVLGSEEMGVSPAFLEACDSSAGRVTIPLAGTKGSLNVGVAGGIMLHHWFSMAE
jgi:TrmH family RNA methyltransferase